MVDPSTSKTAYRKCYKNITQSPPVRAEAVVIATPESVIDSGRCQPFSVGLGLGAFVLPNIHDDVILVTRTSVCCYLRLLCTHTVGHIALKMSMMRGSICEAQLVSFLPAHGNICY